LDIGVLGYIGIVWPKEHSPEVSHIPPGTPCISCKYLLCSDICTDMVVKLLLKYVVLTNVTLVRV
jgi:hypothetical protein